MNVDNRISELLELAEQEGFTLAMPPERIVELENLGFVVELHTGDIAGCAADRASVPTAKAELRYWWLLPDVLAVQR